LCSFWFKPLADGNYSFSSLNNSLGDSVSDSMLIYINGQIITKRYKRISTSTIDISSTTCALKANNYYKVDIFYYGQTPDAYQGTPVPPTSLLSNQTKVPSITWSPTTGIAYTRY
jgi:hypothetical protein